MEYYEERIKELEESIKYNVEIRTKIENGNYPAKDAQIRTCNANIEQYEKLIKQYQQMLSRV
ncbi:MAG: hypothetical protein IJ272_09395 [Clostridia bacterium]|nr:hypothetical protein [Clostridia bacterium]